MPDRSTYRYEEDGRLIEEAKYNPNRELAIALGERLDDVLAQLEYKIGEHKEVYADLERECAKLDDQLYEQGIKIDSLELMLSQREGFIEELQREIAQLKKEDC